MFMQFFKEQASPGFGYLGMAWNATFRPTAVAKTIRIGDRQDFNQRLRFFLAIIAGVVLVQSLVAMALSVSVMPQAVDGIWQYLQPLLAAAIWLVIYLPLRIFRMTKLAFSSFFQAAAMSVGPTLFLTPLNFLPAIVVRLVYGRPGPENAEFTAAFSGTEAQATVEQVYPFCGPAYDSLLCLNVIGSVMPQTMWSSWVITLGSLIALIPIAKLIKHSTGITYSKLLASYVIIVTVIMVVAIGVAAWLQLGRVA